MGGAGQVPQGLSMKPSTHHGEVYQQPIYFLRVEVVTMSVEEVSLYFLGGDPIQYFGLDPIDPRSSSSLVFKILLMK